ncbi:helix-turn-helix domain-containing protein [Fusobacterium hominis]|nr:helix-turn-helix domain-containing protein [Fusobacterium hominis]
MFFSKTFRCVGVVYNRMLNDRLKAYEESQENVGIYYFRK